MSQSRLSFIFHALLPFLHNRTSPVLLLLPLLLLTPLPLFYAYPYQPCERRNTPIRKLVHSLSESWYIHYQQHMMNPRNIALVFSFAAHLTTAFQPTILSPFIAASVARRSSSSSISMDSGLTLYGSQQTRSPLVNWYLEEKSIPFTQKAPRPSAHPFGQTPFLTDNGGVEVFESGAILLYIADAYGGNQLQTRPKPDSDVDSDCL